MNKFIPFITLVVFLALINSCGIYKPVDARKVDPNVEERVKKNLEEGKGWTIMPEASGLGLDPKWDALKEYQE